MPRAQTEIDGSFAVALPAEFKRATLTVLAPGFVLQRQTVILEPGLELTINVVRHGGRILLQMPPNESGKQASPPRVWIVHNGEATFDVDLLTHWAVINGFLASEAQMVIPLLPQGNYEVCWNSKREDTHRLDSHCEDGSLGVDQEWVVNLDIDKGDDGR